MLQNEILWPKNGATIRVLSDEPQQVEVFDPHKGYERPILGIPVLVEQGCLRKEGLLSLNFLFSTEILGTNPKGETVKHHFPSEEDALKELKGCTLRFYHGRSAKGRYWRFFRIEQGVYTLSA